MAPKQITPKTTPVPKTSRKIRKNKPILYPAPAGQRHEVYDYEEKPNGNPRVDYFQFVFSCTAALAYRLQNVKPTWITGVLAIILHGVWPGQIDVNEKPDIYGAKLTHRSLKNCSHYKFHPFLRGDYDKLKPELKKDLSRLWPMITKEKVEENFAWLKDEWRGHGVCADMTAEEYYQMVVHVVTNYLNIYGALCNRQIVPNNAKPYRASQIRKALKEEFGVDFAISWFEKDNKKVLLEVRAMMKWEEGASNLTPPKFMDHNEIYINVDDPEKFSLKDDDELYFLEM